MTCIPYFNSKGLLLHIKPEPHLNFPIKTGGNVHLRRQGKGEMHIMKGKRDG